MKQFAGDDASKPVIFPNAEALITRMEQAQHYRVGDRQMTLGQAQRLPSLPLASAALALQAACATLLGMNLASQLRILLGDDIVADDAETLSAHAGDKWFAAHLPEVVVFARSTDDVSKLLQFAPREKIPVTPRGGGFGYVGDACPRAAASRSRLCA